MDIYIYCNEDIYRNEDTWVRKRVDKVVIAQCFTDLIDHDLNQLDPDLPL